MPITLIVTSPKAGFIDAFVRQARSDGARLFARFERQPLSFAALDRDSDALAAGLRRAGIRPGDRVAVMLRNSPEALVLLFALGKARAVWVPVNVQLRGEGLRYILEHAEPRMA